MQNDADLIMLSNIDHIYISVFLCLYTYNATIGTYNIAH